MQQAQSQSCFFSEYLGQSQERNQLAEDRETVLRAIYLDKGNVKKGEKQGVVRLDSLEALDQYLDKEIERLDAGRNQPEVK